MSITVRFLGTGGSFGNPVVGCNCHGCVSPDPRDSRFRASVLLEWDGARILVDAGPDLRQQCLREGLGAIDEVWLTHAHADHTNGIDDLRVFCLGGRNLTVRGSETTLRETMQRFPYAFRSEADASGVSHPLLRPTRFDGPFEVAGARVVPVPLEHGPFPCTGYRVGDFAYLTDVSRIPDSSWPLLQGVESLVLSALREEPHPTHLSFGQAVEIAGRIRARNTWFTHFAHGTRHVDLERRFPSGMVPAFDGLRLEIG